MLGCTHTIIELPTLSPLDEGESSTSSAKVFDAVARAATAAEREIGAVVDDDDDYGEDDSYSDTHSLTNTDTIFSREVLRVSTLANELRNIYHGLTGSILYNILCLPS